MSAEPALGTDGDRLAPQRSRGAVLRCRTTTTIGFLSAHYASLSAGHLGDGKYCRRVERSETVSARTLVSPSARSAPVPSREPSFGCNVRYSTTEAPIDGRSRLPIRCAHDWAVATNGRPLSPPFPMGGRSGDRARELLGASASPCTGDRTEPRTACAPPVAGRRRRRADRGRE